MGIIGISSYFLILIAGIVLTVITMLRMRSGKISLPLWKNILLCAGMIALLAFTLLSSLPPKEQQPDSETLPAQIIPQDPFESIEAAQ